MKRWTILLLCTASFACDAPVESSLQRVELELAADAAPMPAERVVQRLVVPEDEAAWTLEAPEASIRSVPNPTGNGKLRVARLAGDGPVAVRIPGPFDPGAFNRVEVDATKDRQGDLSVQLWRDGEVVVRSGTRRIPASGAPFSAAFNLFANAREREPYDELVVGFRSVHPGAFTIRMVRLLDRPAVGFLADAAGPAELIEVRGEGRRAKPLSPGRPLTGSFTPGPGSSLVFAVAPLFARRDVPQAELLCQVRAGERLVREERVLPPRGSAWIRVQLDLGDLEGEACSLGLGLAPGSHEGAVLAVSEPWVQRAGPEAPSVLLVTSDTHRADHLQALGLGVPVETPVLDALARRGLMFEDCYSTTNVTNPSHVALMTGLHPRDTRVVTNMRPLLEEAHTLAETFSEAGYATVASVSLRNLGHTGSGLGQGFDRFQAPYQRSVWPAESTLDGLLQWLPDLEGLPVFAWVHLYDAHTPYAPPAEYQDRYWPPEKDPFDEALPVLDVPKDALPPSLRDVRDLGFPTAQYRAEVSYLDHQLARVVEESRFARGIVAVTADHGESLGEHGIYFDHLGMYPDTLHIPLILAFPEAPSGTRIQRRVRQMDVGRTLLDLSGLGGRAFPGRNLLEESEVPRFGLSAHGLVATLNREGWHLVVHLEVADRYQTAAGLERHTTELYRLADDPHCERDLLEAEPERARAMRAELVAWLAAAEQGGLAAGASQDADVLDELEKLGYVDRGEGRSEGEGWIDPDCACAWCERF